MMKTEEKFHIFTFDAFFVVMITNYQKNEV